MWRAGEEWGRFGPPRVAAAIDDSKHQKSSRTRRTRALLTSKSSKSSKSGVLIPFAIWWAGAGKIKVGFLRSHISGFDAAKPHKPQAYRTPRSLKRLTKKTSDTQIVCVYVLRNGSQDHNQHQPASAAIACVTTISSVQKLSLNRVYNRVYIMASSKQSWSLTAHLLATHPDTYQAATQSPFLAAAGEGKLPKHALSSWLANDRLYLHAYIKAAGRTLSAVDLPITTPAAGRVSAPETQLVDWLLEALAGLRREERLFIDTAAQYGLEVDLDAGSEESGALAGQQAAGKLPGLIMYERLFASVHPDAKGNAACPCHGWRPASAFGAQSGATPTRGRGPGPGSRQGAARKI